MLYVKKGYRDAPYHNWTHAFSVAHFAYLLIKNMQLIEKNYMTPLQALVFLVSCLCHDIDHRGTNNSFQTQCGTVLASLYSSEGSVMEVKQCRHFKELTFRFSTKQIYFSLFNRDIILHKQCVF